MNKKILFTIIGIILIAVLVFFVYTKKKEAAIQAGKASLTFREFLGFGNKTGGTTDTGLTSVFDQNNIDNLVNGTTSQTAPLLNFPGSDSGAIFASTFTPNSFSSLNTATAGTANTTTATTGSGGSIINLNTSSTTTATTGTAVNQNNTQNNGTTQPTCLNSDLNITFTQDELNRLQTLQTQFYAVAQNLHSDSDITTEENNRNAFLAKEIQARGLANFCTKTIETEPGKTLFKTAASNNNIPIIQPPCNKILDPRPECKGGVFDQGPRMGLLRKVPTPYWYEPNDPLVRVARDSVTFFGSSLTTSTATTGASDIPKDDPGDLLPNGGEKWSSTPLGYISDPGPVGGKMTTTSGDDRKNARRSMEQKLRLNLW